METATLEQIIRSHVQLGRKNAKGWEECLHLGCDHGRKGNRAAFLFVDGQTAFHCFNCGLKPTYDPDTYTSLPPDMIRVLSDFNIQEEEWQGVLLNSLATRDAGNKNSSANVEQRSIEPKVLEMPKEFYLLSEADEDDKWAIIAKEYLQHERSIDPSSYPFLLCHKTDTPHMKKWLGRVIYPVMKGDKLVYWQGRDLTNKATKKYESPSAPKDCVIYGFDRLFQHSDLPLYIVEGFFDAHVIDGIALMGNELNPAQIKWLNKSRRKKIYIPDRFGDGKRNADAALNVGWSVSTPEIGGCKDINAAVHKYGRMYVLKTIADNVADGFDAQMRLGVYCNGEDQHKRSKKTT